MAWLSASVRSLTPPLRAFMQCGPCAALCARLATLTPARCTTADYALIDACRAALPDPESGAEPQSVYVEMPIKNTDR